MISEGRRSAPRSHITSAAPRVVLQPLTGPDALISIQATPQTQSPLAVAAGFHRAMAAATGDQVSGGLPRPRPRPPEIGTCCGLSRPRRRRRPPGVQFVVVLYKAAYHRASCHTAALSRLDFSRSSSSCKRAVSASTARLFFLGVESGLSAFLLQERRPSQPPRGALMARKVRCEFCGLLAAF